MEPITTTKELAAACTRLAKHDFITVDTEFLRETTYFPILCVAQVASADEAIVIDALAEGIDLAPFFKLMANAKVLKVFHAARQDIEIVWHRAKIIPHPVFDTQVAAMVLGYGESISYDQLVQRITGDTLDKSNRFTDWTRRPLTPAQLKYAVSDVTHLRDVYRALSADIAKRGRAEWVGEEMEILTSPDTYRMEPDHAWQRLKTRVRKPRELAVLIEVAAWREREAQARDVPRGRVLKDEVIGDLAVQAPTSLEKLAGLRSLPKGFERSKWGHEILEAVKRGLARDPKSLPMLERCQAGCERDGDARALEGPAAHDRRAQRRGRQGHRDGRRPGADRRERRRGCAGAERLAARDVRRECDCAQARPAGTGRRASPGGRGGTVAAASRGFCRARFSASEVLAVFERIALWRQTARGISP